MVMNMMMVINMMMMINMMMVMVNVIMMAFKTTGMIKPQKQTTAPAVNSRSSGQAFNDDEFLNE